MPPSVELLPYSPACLEPYFRWRGQAPTVNHNPLQSLTFDQVRAVLESERSELDGAGNYRWFVHLGGHVVGSVSLKNVNTQMGYAELGYGFCETSHGRGVGTAAVRLVVARVFAETSLRKLVAYVHDQNVASCRLLDRLGFVREGLLREHYLILGAPADEVVFGLLRREWNVTPA
ncbi:MAG: GNAT family protein [Pseudomonadota bacterium]|nr:GNAT family protein [Pseudomonadota bacterium]